MGELPKYLTERPRLSHGEDESKHAPPKLNIRPVHLQRPLYALGRNTFSAKSSSALLQTFFKIGPPNLAHKLKKRLLPTMSFRGAPRSRGTGANFGGGGGRGGGGFGARGGELTSIDCFK